MKASLGLEFIGANTADSVREFRRGGITPNPKDLGRNHKRPWVAEITGCSRGVLTRQFVRGQRDYSQANGTGSRGIWLFFILEYGRVYEIFERLSWTSCAQYFCTVDPFGEIHKLTREEVMRCLNFR